MTPLQSLQKELDYYFKHHKTKTLTVFTSNKEKDAPDDAFLSIKKEGLSYNVSNSDKDNAPSELLSANLLKTNFPELELLYAHIKKHNDQQRARYTQWLPLVGALGLGLISAVVLISALVTGGLSLPFIAGIGVVLGGGIGASLLALLSLNAVKQFGQWLSAKKPALETNDDAFQYTRLEKTPIEKLLTPLTKINQGLKWLARQFILDTSLSKYVIGSIIAGVANSGNEHYTTKAKSIDATLGPLIFPGGLMDPDFDTAGELHLGPVLSAQYLGFRTFQQRDKSEDKYPWQPFKVQMKDKGIELDCIEASNCGDEEPDLYLICFNGNSGCYEQDVTLMENQLEKYDDEGRKVHTILFNYPGVLHSKTQATSGFDLVEAGIAQVERLHQEFNIPYEKIGLQGASLGGCMSLQVANYYNQRDVHFNGTYVVDTFASTNAVGGDYVAKIPVVGPLLQILFRPFIAFGLWGTKSWNLNSGKAYTEVPRWEREHAVSRSSKAAREATHHLDDNVLRYQASLHNAPEVQDERLAHKKGLGDLNAGSYSQINRRRKLVVCKNPQFDGDLDFEQHHVAGPDVCAHSEAEWLALGHDEDWQLHHRAGQVEGHEGDYCKIKEHNHKTPTTGNAATRARNYFFTDKEVRKDWYYHPKQEHQGNIQR